MLTLSRCTLSCERVHGPHFTNEKTEVPEGARLTHKTWPSPVLWFLLMAKKQMSQNLIVCKPRTPRIRRMIRTTQMKKKKTGGGGRAQFLLLSLEKLRRLEITQQISSFLCENAWGLGGGCSEVKRKLRVIAAVFFKITYCFVHYEIMKHYLIPL